MADKRSTVELVFQGIDKTGQATQAALRNAEQFSRSVGNVTAPVADFTKKAVAMEAALLATGVAITAFSIKAAGDFDEAFREIATLIDEPIDELGEFKQAILEYAGTSTQSLEEVTGAVYSAISAGVDYTQSLEAVAAAEQLAVAGKAGLQESLVVLVSSLNAYGASMDEAQSFADALFTTVAQGQTTLPELANSLSQVTSLAANAGVDFEELLSAIAALTATGAPTSQAITSIRAAISNIIKPTADARDLAEELGIEFNATALESGGLKGVLDDVAEATGGNTEQMARLFGSTEALNAVLGLTGEGADAFVDSLAAMENSTGAVEQAFATMADSVSNSNQQVANAIQSVLIAIGGPLLDEYGGVADAIAAIFNAIGQNVSQGQLGGLVAYLESVMADAVNALAAIAQALPEALELADLSGFQNGIEAVIESIQNLFEGFDLTTPQGLANAIEGLGQAFSTLSSFTAGAIESLQWIFDALANGDGDVLEFAEQWANAAGNIAGFATQLNAVMPAIDTLISALTGLVGILAVKQTGSIVSSVTKARGGLGALAAAMGPGGAVAVAAIYLGTQLYKIVEGLGEIKDANERAEEAQNSYELSIARVTGTLKGLSDRLGINIADMDEFRRLVEEGAIVFDESTGRWEAGGEAIGGAGDMAQEAGEKIKDSTFTAAEGADALSQALARTGGDFGDLVVSVEDGSIKVDEFGETATTAYEKAAQAAEEATQESENYRIKMAEIASDERIRTIEARFEFEAEALIQEARRVESAFESINNTVNSTGDLIDSLTGRLLETRFSEEFEFVQDLIKREEERRNEAIELQKELTRAQIEAMEARTEALASGQALINVDGAGLQPHLEAFMWEILREIQVRVNADGFEMLLGTNG